MASGARSTKRARPSTVQRHGKTATQERVELDVWRGSRQSRCVTARFTRRTLPLLRAAHVSTAYHAHVDDRRDLRFAELAGAESRSQVAGGLMLLAVGAAATVLADQRPEVLHVLAVALAVGGYQMWARRRWIPGGLPTRQVPVDAIKPASRHWVFWLVFFPAMLGVLFGALEHLGGGSSTMLGFFGGGVAAEIVTGFRVAHWQRRHGETLVWVGWGEASVLAAPAAGLGASPAHA